MLTANTIIFWLLSFVYNTNAQSGNNSSREQTGLPSVQEHTLDPVRLRLDRRVVKGGRTTIVLEDDTHFKPKKADQ